MSVKEKMPMLDLSALRKTAVETLDENKARDIKDIDVSQLTDVVDAIIVCTATSTRHASALADKLIRAMKNEGIKPLGVEGAKEGKWILVDLQDIVVHIMLENIREFYDLERLWAMTEEVREKREG
jgi:ribosome-associated protein